MTIKEANNLYDKIKSEYPNVWVIISFAPLSISDFSLIEELKWDAIEFNFVLM